MLQMSHPSAFASLDITYNGPETEEYPLDYQYEKRLDAKLNSTCLNHFSYTNHPLKNNDIRLFRLCPTDINNHSHLNQPLRGTIITSSLDLSPSYVALSYVWGPQVFSRILHCNDDKQLRITRGLDLALKRFRATLKRQGVVEEMAPLIWVDQICINQQDAVERSAQVQLMKRIYSQAERVFVYLGELVGRVAEALGSMVRGEYQNLTTADDLLLPIHATHQLSNIEWFYRHWIIQEVVACPRRTWLGSNLQIEGDVLRLIYENSVGSTDITHQVSSILHFIEAKENGAPLKLFESVLASLSFQASEPKDRIYSLLAIVADGDDYPVPNYNHSVEQVYQDFAKSFARKGHGLSLISIAASQGLLRTPSWVPDWQNSSWSGIFADHEAHFEAGSRSTDDVGVFQSNSILYINGVTVDSITATADTYSGDLRTNEWISSSVKFIQEDTVAVDGLSSLLKLARLVFMNENISIEQLKKAVAPPKVDPNSEMVRMVQQGIGSLLSERTGIPRSGGEETLFRQNISQHMMRSWHFTENFFKDLAPSVQHGTIGSNFQHSPTKQAPLVFCGGVKMARTYSGRLCLVPASCKPQDKIYVLLGAAQPFLLRKQADSTAYRVVGNVYAEGVMHGEAVKAPGFRHEQVLLC